VRHTDASHSPKHYYDQRFDTHTPQWLSDVVVQHLSGSSFAPQRVPRGPDHGVWVPLKAAFGAAAPLPLVQVSLPAPSGDALTDARAALALGEALRGLREQGIAVLGSGQPVHNLRDAFGGGGDGASGALRARRLRLTPVSQARTAGRSCAPTLMRSSPRATPAGTPQRH
jgi:aromatic ring-opening dioxygenase catalytic subunit (LigB family)